jgi:hypothetical protein
MWQRLNGEAKAGWGSPLGDPKLLADCIATLARDPEAINTVARNAWEFSRAHGFLPEFRRRMEHLARVAGIQLLPVAA